MGRTKVLMAFVILAAFAASTGTSQAYPISSASGQNEISASPGSRGEIQPSFESGLTVKGLLAGEYDALFVDKHLAGMSERVRAKVSRSDQKATKQRAGNTVVVRVGPKSSPSPAPLRSVKVGDGYRVTFGVGQSSPSAAERQSMQEGIEWYEPDCTIDGNAERWYIFQAMDDGTLEYIGWADGCTQWAGITYPSQTKQHWGFKMTMTCRADRLESGFYSVFEECGVETEDHPDSAPLSWDSWDPPADAVSGCLSYSASIGVGPVSATVPLDLCEKVVISKGAIAPNFGSYWQGGETYNQHRNAASLIGFGSEFGTTVALYRKYTVTYRLLPIVP